MSSALAQPVLQWEHRYPGSSPPAGLADKAIGVYSDGTNVYAAGTKFKGTGNSVFNVTQYELAGSGGVGQIDSDIEWPADTSVDRQVRGVTATDFWTSTNGQPTISLLVGTVPGDTGTRVAWAAFDNQNTGSSGDLRMLWSRVDDPDYDEASYNEVPVSVSIDPSGTSAVAAVQITHGISGLKEIAIRIVAMSDGARISASSFAPSAGAECVGAITDGGVVFTAGTTTVSGRKRMFILGTWHSTGAFLDNSPLIVDPGSGYDLVAVKNAVPLKITNNAVWSPFAVVARRTEISTGDTDIYTSTYTTATSGSATSVVAGNLSQYWDASNSGIDYDEPVDIAIASYRQTEDGDEALARPHVFVCGTTRNGSGNTKIVALQYQEFIYNASTMPSWLEWYNVWERGTSQDHVSHAITFSLAPTDGTRFVHVTGASKNSSGDFDYVTLKYLAQYVPHGANQTSPWETLNVVPIWAGPSGSDHSYGIWANWVSDTPNFYTTGSSYHSTTADDWMTLRYTDP